MEKIRFFYLLIKIINLNLTKSLPNHLIQSQHTHMFLTIFLSSSRSTLGKTRERTGQKGKHKVHPELERSNSKKIKKNMAKQA